MYKSITAIVPAYNEALYIEETMKGLFQIEGIEKIIVVDDGSTDDTLKIIKKIRKDPMIIHIEHSGKGAAIKKALAHVQSEYVALIDADLGESVTKFQSLIDLLSLYDNTMLTAVMPMREGDGGFGLLRSTAQWGYRVLTGKTIESLLCGQRIIPTAFIKAIDLPEDYSLEFKLAVEAHKHGLNIIELPIDFTHRVTKRDLEGFIHRGRQFSQIVKTIFRELLYK